MGLSRFQETPGKEQGIDLDQPPQAHQVTGPAARTRKRVPSAEVGCHMIALLLTQILQQMGYRSEAFSMCRSQVCRSTSDRRLRPASW